MNILFPSDIPINMCRRCLLSFHNRGIPFLFALLLSLIFVFSVYSQPTGFVDQVVSTTWNQAVGITWDAGGRMFVWEKGGRVLIDNGAGSSTLLIDISEEVGNWSDYGLVGFALDPNFLTNGYIYLFYVVDRHHLLHFGTPTYDPAVNEYINATIGRLTRYTAEASTNFTTVDFSSRKILLGSTKKNGIPIMSGTHGVGSAIFATDGSLMLSIGEGASPNGNPIDEGSNPTSFWSQALADSIITPVENVGAYRSQMLTSYSGKILRIDPETGFGLASNPYYIASNPDSVSSKIWAMGVRNPYRMTQRPNTGSHIPDDGDPGIFYFGDVGAGSREELNVITGPGQNFGWPIYE